MSSLPFHVEHEHPHGPSEGGGRDQAAALRVVSYNIHHGADTADRLDLARTAAVLARSGADLIGLQEVDRHWSERSAFADQAKWLATTLGMHVAYAANLDLDPLDPDSLGPDLDPDSPGPGRQRRQYGLAVLSRFPILTVVHELLPPGPDSEPDLEPRGLLAVEVDVDGERLCFATTHLSEADPRARESEATRVAEILGAAPRRTILTGDLNAQPTAPETKPLTGVLTDAWPDGDADPDADPGHTIPVAGPDRRIDYVLVSPDLTAERAWVLTDADASDHLPVVADVRL
ncbi:endonuclease/exonuclease/phosphatase family protein [Actinopolymorpha cephalotaxi]|uniref:Endonuclease/exonuclease/phosphatase family metal-dependent hydrolase n=1 Tax=Actinopolymorpha cephalotaxi TaxID=504797 RepID=A0ABX2SCQ0_9ACTN|nr:endonuclease/exonuclease/phosphatase family protein [Actinopolymorpha cephalotaxi]NYH86698.1 endonuclease/exonuclease/phosphatase family metal-dependent hydrolase [Actinopolymorpha cephalotaxi]